MHGCSLLGEHPVVSISLHQTCMHDYIHVTSRDLTTVLACSPCCSIYDQRLRALGYDPQQVLLALFLFLPL